jgi:hypothetical protein
MARKFTKKWNYWFLLESGRAVWVHNETGEMLVEHSDHLLYEPTQHETNEIIARVISDEFLGG